MTSNIPLLEDSKEKE
jgi:hypothetical protein